MFYLYAIIGPTDKIYFGITKDPKERWRAHRKSKENRPLYNAMRKYGRDNFLFAVLSEHETADEVVAAEIAAIASVGTQNDGVGYNLSSGGEYGGPAGVEAIRAKLRDDPQYREAFSLRTTRTVTETWAGRSAEEKKEIFAKISDTLKAKNRDDPEFYEKQRRAMLAARAKGDVKQRAAAASKGIKKWWDELRADPERYAEYIATRRETLMETLERKKA